jgi:hypothetical protein
MYWIHRTHFLFVATWIGGNMHTNTRAAVASIALALLVLACGGSSGTTTNAPAPTAIAPVAIGEKANGDGYTLTIAGVERKGELSQFEKAKDGNTYLVADALVEATGNTPYNLLYFKVKDSTGVEYNPAVTSLPDGFKSGELQAGDKARGKVVFEIPDKATGLVLSYKPLTLGSGDAIRVKLD